MSVASTLAADLFVVPDYTRLAQQRAADPRASAWVSANAGAGKTKVLTDRVLRLLLAGARPGQILCLTFTKAAAANMAIRIFERLGRWVTLDDKTLAEELLDLEGIRPGAERLRLARRLFAHAVETPGGLKIDTIHAFCERLLHLVPFEANVPARFAVLDESQADELVAQATVNVLADAASGAFPHLAAALAIVSIDAPGDALAATIGAAIRAKAEGHAKALRAALGLSDSETKTAVARAILEDGITPLRWPELAARLRTGRDNDDKRAAAFAAASVSRDVEEQLQHYRSIFFGDDGTARAKTHIVTKVVDPRLKDELLDEQARLIGLFEKYRAAAALERTEALCTLAGEITARVERAKARLGALDFQDLIDKTLALLSRGDAAWVLYKLDRGIDHVLIDEAQDTNPEQWEILRHITADFTSGAGTRGSGVRTLFAVGDPKQSIYGFQGAVPQEFEIGRKRWRDQTAAAELRFEDVRLTVSFRSAKAVLSAVDATFAIPEHFKGLSFEDTAVGTVHESARPEAPGLVELWPIEEPAPEKDEEAWELPLDAAEPSSPPVVLAGRIARAVRQWITRGDETGRVFSPGDVLLLVRRRGPAFEAVIRALKAENVPVAGADRLDIGEHIAVLDLVSAGRSALLPEDDLTLACALKSPLVGLTDEDLLRIAAPRGADEPLVAALERHAAQGDAAAKRGWEALQDWRKLARSLGPFGFYATLLGPLRARSQLVARLGSEAGDAIDAFLCFAHNAERGETPSLTTFLNAFESASHTIKRDLDATGSEVRVMTVHGAKGLEAPVVVLIDGCEALDRAPALIPVADGKGGTLHVWSPAKGHDSQPIAEAREALRQKAQEEHNRLLYVAMTRAKDRLVIAPYRTSRNPSAEAWCEMVRRGLTAKVGGLEMQEAPYGTVEVWRDGSVHPAARSEASPPAVAAIEVPPWLSLPVAHEPEPAPPIRPSSALSAADRIARPGDGPYAPEARLRGTVIHALLERLPEAPAERREALARSLLAARAPRLSPAAREDLVADALRVLTLKGLKPLFSPGSRAEAAIAGEVMTAAGRVAVSGQIDRLAIADDEVLLADFKTTARPPGPDEPSPPAYVAQLALYRALLSEIYPGRAIRAFLIWTSGPLVRELRDEELSAAISSIKAP